MFCSEALLLAYTRLPSHAASVDPLIEVCVSVCVFVHRVVFLHHLLCNLIVCAGLSTLLGISILFSHVQRWYVCTVSVCVCLLNTVVTSHHLRSVWLIALFSQVIPTFATISIECDHS